MEAQEWLQSAKHYDTGLEILRNVKGESLVWRLLAKGKSFYNCQRLEQEILALVKEEEALMECANCHKKDPEVTLARCTGCYSVSFCSKKCQVSMWKSHKPVCLARQERNKAEIAQQERDETNGAVQEPTETDMDEIE